MYNRWQMRSKHVIALLSFELQIHLVSKAKNGSFKNCLPQLQCNLFYSIQNQKNVSNVYLCIILIDSNFSLKKKTAPLSLFLLYPN